MAPLAPPVPTPMMVTILHVFTQSIGSLTFLITFISSIWFNSAWIFGRKVTGTHLGG